MSSTELAHFGVKGMRWGVRKADREVSADAARSSELKTKVKKQGAESLSNKEMQELITRMNLDRQLSQLSGSDTNPAQKFVTDKLKQIGSQEAAKLAAQGSAWLIKKYLK